MNELILPKIYENELGNYPQHKGKPKVSWSQFESFNDDGFIYGYIQNYLYNIPSEQGIFAEFGSACGEYFETGNVVERLSEEDVEILNKLKRPKNAVYEREIVIDRGEYVIQGFIDMEYKQKGLHLLDFKTGSPNKKDKYSNLEKYFQTRVYAYQRENEGEKIVKCGVWFFNRKGNIRFEDVTETNAKNVLRLIGEPEYIDTPYIREEVEEFLETKVDITVQKISELYQFFKNE